MSEERIYKLAVVLGVFAITLHIVIFLLEIIIKIFW